MLHIRRKAEIQNLNNINASVGNLATCLDEEKQGECAETEPGLAPPASDVVMAAQPSLPTALATAALPVSSPDLLPEGLGMPDSAPDTSSATKPETKGLYGYVKTRILQLLQSPS
jgi:hypothetical protein